MVKCRYCRYITDCAISKGLDWFCADGESISNIEENEKPNYLEMLLNNNKAINEYIPPNCRHCTNHPSNGGSGICNCILGSMMIT